MDMNREWKPGLVADVTMVNGEKRQEHSPAFWDSYNGQWVSPTAGRLHPGGEWALEARPLVVIDPEDREAVERLAQAYLDKFGGNLAAAAIADQMQAALREFANPTPPRIEEPMGHIARVRDREGDLWARIGDNWVCEHGGVPRDWDYLVNECAPLEVTP